LSGLKKGATQADLRIEERGEAFSGWISKPHNHSQ
jgi:hypothetical protein